MDLLQKLKTLKPNTKEITLKTYIQNLSKLKRSIDGEPIKDNLNFLYKEDDVNKFLNEYADNTRKNYLNAIIVSLQAVDGKKEAIEKFIKERDDVSKKYREGKTIGEMNEKEKKNIISFEEWDKIIEKLNQQIKANKLKKAKDLDLGDYTLLLRHLILTLYRKYPLRNDFHNMKVISRREAKKELPKDFNYLIIYNKGMKFVLSDYKTAKTYDDIELSVDKETQKTIRAFLKKSPNPTYLITDFTGKPFSSNRLTKFIQRAFTDLLGKKVGSSMLRKSYLSGKYGKLLKEMKKDANMMGHSLKVQQQEYIKTDEEKKND
jgi:integrase